MASAQLLVLENGVFTRGTSVAKRSGYESVASNADYIRLAARDDELLAFTRGRAYAINPDGDDPVDTGAVLSVVGSNRPAVRTGTEQTEPDHATNGGVSVYAWEDSLGGVYYTVEDSTSGRIHIAPTLADADGISPRCVPAGAALHIYYANATLGYIYVLVINPTAPTATVAPAILVDDLNTTNPVYDAVPTDITGTPVGSPLIVWHERASTNCRFGYVEPSGALGTPLGGYPSVVTFAASLSATTPLAIGFIDDQIAIIATDNADQTTATIFDGEFAGANSFETSNTAGPLHHTCAFGGDGTLWVASDFAGAVSSKNLTRVSSGTANDGLLTGPTIIRSVGLASRAFQCGEDPDVFATFLHDTTYFNTYLTLRLSDFACVARILPGNAADAPVRRHLPSAHVLSDVASIALPYNERVKSENADQFTETGIRLVELDFASDDSHQYAQLGRGLYLAGACPQHYDGRQWTEQGFHVGPEAIVTANSGAGALEDDTTYLYRAWYEWTDAQGEVHRGPVSFGTIVTLAAAEDEVTITLPMLRVTKKPNVRICLARSEAAKTGRTASLYRVTSLDPSASGPNGYVANDPTVDTATFVDRMSDAVLATMEPLYTNGGILSNDPCALGSLIARSKSRLFTSDPADPYGIRFSQPLEEGYGVEFCPENVIKCDPLGGPVSAIADQDGTLIIWQATAIRAVEGTGPLPNGDTATAGFTEPRLVSSAVGCTQPASLALTPTGHIFASGKGLWRIDRSGQVEYVGAAAEAFNAQRTTAATVLPDRTSIVFLTDDGTTLLYDYLFGQWSTFTNHLGLGAAVISGVYHYLRTDGRVFRETVGSYSDAGQRITLRMETAWIHVADALQGFQRFWNLLLLGTWRSPHQLRIQHRTNYADDWTEPRYLDATGESSSTGWVTGGLADTIGTEPILGTAYGAGAYGAGPYGRTANGVYQWRYHIGGRGQSVRFRFEDFERDGIDPGASFELTEMLIEGGVAGPSAKPFTGARSA